MLDVLIKNALIVTCDERGQIIENGYVTIADGLVVEVGAGNPPPQTQAHQIVDAAGKVMIPGLINAHCHSYANYVKGMAPTIRLEYWMLYIMAQGQIMTPEDIYWNVMLGALEMIKTGTTCCIDHLAQGYDALDAAMQAYRDIGLRAALAPMFTDKPYYSTLPIQPDDVPQILRTPAAPAQELLDINEKLLHSWHNRENGRLKIFVGPSGPQRCSDDFLRETGRQAREWQTGWHSHVLETQAQAQTAQLLYGQPMLMQLRDLGCLGPMSTLVHAVWLGEDEIKLAAESGAVVVHNPSSNFMLGSGIAPVNQYRAHGVPVALGTDGVNVSGNHSLFGSMQLAAIIHNPGNPQPETWIQPADVLAMATHNGARAVLEPRLGRIAPGMKADLSLLKLQDNCIMTPLNNIQWQLVHSEPNELVDSVMIDGKLVLANGTLVSGDEEKILFEATKRGERLRRVFKEQKEPEVLQKMQALQQLM